LLGRIISGASAAVELRVEELLLVMIFAAL
jgi:hypothetical protein